MTEISDYLFFFFRNNYNSNRLKICALFFNSYCSLTRRSSAGALYYREVMVFASGVAAVIALLALATPAKKNLDKANQGMERMKPFPPFWDSLPTTV